MNRRMTFAALSMLVLLGSREAVSQQTTNVPTALAVAPATFTNQFFKFSGDKTNLTEITANQVRMYTDKKIAYYDSDVVVADPSFLMRSDHLVVFLSQTGSGMEHSEAMGDVVIVQDQEKRRWRSEKAVYTTADERIVLTGNPMLDSEKAIEYADMFTIFRTNNIFLAEGHTRTILKINSSPNPGAQTNAAPKSENK